MTNYILIDAETRAPVPLPFDTTDFDERPTTIHSFRDPQGKGIKKYGLLDTNLGPFLPQTLGLALITEEEFMAERG